MNSKLQLKNYSNEYIKNNIISLFDKDDLNNMKIIQKEEKIKIRFYNSLYEELKEAFLYVLNLSANGSIKGELTNVEIRNYNSYYMPENINEYIIKNRKKQLNYSHTFFGKVVAITFVIFKYNEDLDIYNKYAENMFVWLYICCKYSRNNICAKNLNVYIYHTPYLKYTIVNKSETFGTKHINSAFTTSCTNNGEIVIFRKEEWFKVFIHETFHIFGFDFSMYNFDILKEELKKIFPIKCEFSIIDSYCEVWARVINCAFTSFLSLKYKKYKNYKNFELYMNLLLEIERYYSLIQLTKILDCMDMKYSNLYKNDKKSKLLRINYKEETHLFCYYIISCLFLNDINGFIMWCFENNYEINYNLFSIIKFNYSEKSLKSFSNYIKSIYKKKEITQNIKNIKKNMNYFNNDNNSLRMSIIEYI